MGDLAQNYWHRFRKSSHTYVWIYKNSTSAEEFEYYHPYFILISLLLKDAFKPCKRRKQRNEGNEWKLNEWRKKEKDWLCFKFYIVTLRREFSSLTPLSKIQTYTYMKSNPVAGYGEILIKHFSTWVVNIAIYCNFFYDPQARRQLTWPTKLYLKWFYSIFARRLFSFAK